MFDSSVKEFFKIVRGDSSLSSILFHIVSGFVFGSVFFIVFNINGEVCKNCLAPIRIDYDKFFALPAAFASSSSPYGQFAKTIEYVLFVLIWIGLTSFAHFLMKRLSLQDALTPIRKQLLGQWALKLSGFANDGQAVRNFTCKLQFSQTKAKKLRVYYSEANELDIRGNTSMIAIAVSGDSPESSQIELSLPVISKIFLNNSSSLVTYWINLAHTPQDHNKNLSFTGDWFKCMGPSEGYQSCGKAELTYIAGPPQPAE